MSDTPRTDAYEEKMLFEGLQDSFRVRNIFDTMRDLERELAEKNKSFSETVKWVPVSDRHPTRVGDEFIIASSTGYVTTCEYAGDGKWRGLDERHGDDYWTQFVTHWMPLPETPK